MTPDAWNDLLREHVLPALPGRWTVASNLASRLPHRHLSWVITRQVRRSGSYKVDAIVVPQFTYSDVLDITVGHRNLGPQPRGRLFNTDVSPPTGHPGPDELRALIVGEGLPHLHEHGATVARYVQALHAFAADRPGGRGTVHTESTAAAAHILLGQADQARSCYANVLAEALALARPYPDWLRDLVRTAEQRLDLDDDLLLATVQELHAVEERMRAQWGLPDPEDPEPSAGLHD